MKWIVEKDAHEVAKRASLIYKDLLEKKPSAVLGLATGSTPERLYHELIQLYSSRMISFKQCTTFNLDEYYPLANEHPQSYHYYMQEKLFKHIDVNEERVYMLAGDSNNLHQECERYEALLMEKGPIDLQLLGIGRNGHIGFNEPNGHLMPKTHVVTLDRQTIEDNARFFSDKEEVPTLALTMGIHSIHKAKKILLLATGEEKAKILSELKNEIISTKLPASFLHLHDDVTIICDEAAASLMK